MRAMTAALIATIVALGLALAITPAWARLCERFRWVDQPDGTRKRHRQAIPRLGGVAIVIAYGSAYWIVELLWDLPAWPNSVSLPGQLAPAAAVILWTGILDDLWELRPWEKVLGQTTAALLACWGDIRVDTWFGWHLPEGLSIAVTVFWLLLATNAFNLIDGLDGLAAGLGLLASMAMCLAGLVQPDLGLVLATAPLAGALAGFLRYNFAPASVFLGDSGSLVVGFLIGSYAVIWTQKSAATVGLLVPAMLLAVPLVDTCLAIVRRLIIGQSLFEADARHIHHRLLERGLTVRDTVLGLYAAAVLGASLSLAASLLRGHAAGVTVLLFLIFTVLGVRALAYPELASLAELIGKGELQRWIRVHARLKELEEQLVRTTDATMRWRLIHQAMRELQIEPSRLVAPLPAASTDRHEKAVAVAVKRMGTPRIGVGSSVEASSLVPSVSYLASVAGLARLTSTYLQDTHEPRIADLEAGGAQPAVVAPSSKA